MKQFHLSLVIRALSISVAALPCSAQLSVVAQYTDTDGNGVVSDNEFIYQANAHFDKIIRMNSDGYQIGDPDQIIDDMVAYVKSMFGDLDGDGTISMDDMLAQIANSGPVSPLAPNPLQGDVNQDGVVDGQDVVLLLDALGTETEISESYALALWGEILLRADEAGYTPTLAESLIGESTYGGHRGPNDHNQTITATWPPPPAASPPGEWDWPSDHLGTVSSTWPGSDTTVGYPPDCPDWPNNHHGTISTTWGDRGEDYWPPNHDIARSSAWNSDGMHESMTSSTWPAGHLQADSRGGTEDSLEHVAIVSAQNGDHDTQVSANAGWPPNHIEQISWTWNTDHETEISASWPSNHLKNISDSWPNPNPGWPPNHWGVVSATWNQPGDHSMRISILTSPSNPFRLPLSQFVIPLDLIGQLDLN